MRWERWLGPDCEDPDSGLRPSAVRDSLHSYVFNPHRGLMCYYVPFKDGKLRL